MSGPTGEEPDTVVVGADGSQTGQAALRRANHQARARHGRVRVIQGWTSPYDRQIEVSYPVDPAAVARRE